MYEADLQKYMDGGAPVTVIRTHQIVVDALRLLLIKLF